MTRHQQEDRFSADGSVAELERGELAAIYELGRAINVNLALDQTATAALQGILKAVSPDLAFLFLREGDRLILTHLLPPASPHRLGVIPEHRAGHCMCGLAVSEGRALYSRNIHDDVRCTWDECKGAGLVSFAALPLRSQGEIIGVIGLASAAERDFERQSRFLETLASQISVAMTNARLHETLQAELAERTRADVRLRESEERFRKLVENAPLAMAIVSMDGVIEFINHKAVSVFGYLPEDIPTMQRWWAQAYPDEAYRNQVVASWMGLVHTAVANGSEIAGREYRVTCKDGTVKTIFISGVPVAGKVFVLFDDISERKRAEEALRQDEEKFRIAFENAPMGMVRIAADGRFLAVNPAFCQMVGYTSEELLAGTFGNITYPDDIEPSNRWVRKQLSGDVSQTEIEKRYVHKDGHVIWAVVRSRWVRDAAGAPRFSVAHVQDITERKAAEQALRESEQRYRLVSELATDYVYKLGVAPNRTVTLDFVSDNFYSLTGRTKDDAVTIERWRDIIHPDDLGRVLELLERLVVRPGSAELECRSRGPGQTPRWVRVLARSEWDERENRVTTIVGAVKDITERKIAEEALRESEVRFRTVFEQAEDCIFIAAMNEDGTVIIKDANPTVTRVLGYEHDELIGKPTAALEVDPDAAEQARQRYQKVSAGEVMTYCAKRPCKDGSIREFECVAKKFVAGSTTLAISFQRDITERLRAEQERRDLQDHLYQAQKMEAIGTLAGGIAHDFNNILAGIMGGLSLFEVELGEAGKQHPDIQETKALVGRGADLAKELLGFARGGRYDVRPLDLGRVVAKTSSMFGRTRKDITMQLDIGPGLLAVLMDHTQLEQVLLNLLLNAGQAMPEGGRVLVRAENAVLGSDSEDVRFRGAAPGRFIKLMVTDTGVGMDAATQARIFDPFFTTKEVGQGTGLGLASVYGIIKGHGGLITVESQQGEGTTFTLLLPATDSPAARETASPAPIQRGRGTVLVVDDEDPVRRSCARMLEQIGYDVLAAAGGRQAVELLRQYGERISLVMLDMTMPDLNGGQTYDRLKEIAPGIKVLLCSGYSIDGQARKILERGCNGFIQKPFDIAALSAKLLEIL